MDRRQLAVRKMIRGLGMTLESFDQSSGHIRATVSLGGVSKKVTFPVTPSDRRWQRNQESFLKKLFR